MMLKRLSGFLFGTLRGRLIIGVAAVHAVMMALFISDLTVRQRAMLLDRQIEQATALSRALATSAAGWIAANDIAGLQELAEAQRRYPEMLFAILADRDGRVLADTDRSRQGLYLLDLPREARLTLLSGNPALVDIAVPAMIGGRHVGWVRVGIGQKVAGEKLGEIIRAGVVYALAAILIGSLIAWQMGKRISRRLYAVQETIDDVRSGNRLARSSLSGSDEAAVMAREFNAMLDAVALRDAELRISEERYRSLIHKVQVAIVLHDGQGRILDSNPLAQRLLGLSADQLLGRELIDPEWRFLREDGSPVPVAEYPVSQVLSSRQPLRNHVVGINRPEQEHDSWMLINAEPEYDEAGDIALIIVSFIDITERKQAEELLRISVRSYRMAQAISHVGNWEYNLQTTEFWGSDEAKRIYGFDPGEDSFSTDEVEQCIPERERVHQALVDLIAEDKPYNLEFEIHPKNSTEPRTIVSIAELQRDENGDPLKVVGVIQDITYRKRAEAALHRLNRELRAISDCNQVLMKASDEQALLTDVCRIICDKAGYRMAWVGYPENDDKKTIHPVASAGVEDGYLVDAAISWADVVRGRGPSGEAIRTGESACVQDFATAPQIAPWREAALQRGYRSSIALPLKDESANTFGVLNIYSAEPNAFNQDETRLLEELAGDLAFGISVLRTRTAGKQASRDADLMNFALNNVHEAAFLIDEQARFHYVNEESCRILGYSRDELLGMGVMDVDPGFPPGRWPAHWQELAVQRTITFEGRHKTKDGRVLPVEVNANYIEYGGQSYDLALVRDITERKRSEQERLAHLRFFESMDRVNLALHGATNLEQMMGDLLDGVLSILECDRAFLMYPCDPESETWSAPMERNKPEFPGVRSLGIEMPMSPDVAETLRILLDSDGPVKFGPGSSHPLPEEVSERFGFKCFMSMAIYPKVGQPWQFGIHQCSYARVWTEEEERIFQEIGRRLADSMTSLLMYRDLQESEERYRMVFENSPVSIWEEDFTGVSALFDDLKKEGITDIGTHFAQHPESVRHCADLVKIVDVNRAALALHGAVNKKELFAGLANTFTTESFDVFRQELVCLWNGGTKLAKDAVVKTLAGEPRHVTVYFSVCPGYEGSFAKVLVSLTDISARKQAEEALMKLNEELDLRVKRRTAELEEKNRELERANKLFVGRELRMVELKGRIKELEEHIREFDERGGA